MANYVVTTGTSHSNELVAAIVIGTILIWFFAKRLQKQTAIILSNIFIVAAAYFGLNTTNSDLVNIFGSNSDVQGIALVLTLFAALIFINRAHID